MNEKVDCRLKSIFLTALSLLPDSNNPFTQSQLNKNYTSFIAGGMINKQPTNQTKKNSFFLKKGKKKKEEKENKWSPCLLTLASLHQDTNLFQGIRLN